MAIVSETGIGQTENKNGCSAMALSKNMVSSRCGHRHVSEVRPSPRISIAGNPMSEVTVQADGRVERLQRHSIGFALSFGSAATSANENLRELFPENCSLGP